MIGAGLWDVSLAMPAWERAIGVLHVESVYLLTSRYCAMIKKAKLPARLNNSPGSNKGPRKGTKAALAASNMWSQLWRTLVRDDLQSHRRLKLPVWLQLSLWQPGYYWLYCYCWLFLEGPQRRGSNPPVSTHINGLIGLFSHSQNPDLSLTERLSPFALKYPRNVCKVTT